jgi:hypothetical protein
MGRGRVDAERRAAALAMRLEGCSYREIQAALGVPKSTLSGWLCDVPLSDEHHARLAQRSEEGARSRAIAIRASRIRRTEVLQAAAASEIGGLTDRELFLLGVVAYWCEGSKAKAWGRSAITTTFINSDPGLIRLFVRWTALVGVAPADLIYRLSIHESADVSAATAYWRSIVGGEDGQWRRPSLKRHRPTTARQNTADAYVGCLVVSVRRSTDLNRRIAGWYSGIARALRAASVPSTARSGMV